MADHGHEHDEPPHQAPWVFYMTVGIALAVLAFFLTVKYGLS